MTHDDQVVGTVHGHGPVVIPVLPVRDLDRATTLHRELGLDVERYDDGYAWVRLGGHEVWHLRVVHDLDPTTNPTTVYVFVDDLEGWRARAAGAGLEVTAIVDQPWGLREFSARDPHDGTTLRAGCPSPD